jgi:fructoselysine-6-P-deglycase FrlB-like protein
LNHVSSEIQSQPDCWVQAAGHARRHMDILPRAGERVAVVGCGTSWFMAQAYAMLREDAGMGETDAFAASEVPVHRPYDRVVALTRSGTTTEVLELLAALRGKVRTAAITGDPDTPVMTAADDVLALDFADEKSVVQTRFATAALALLRHSLGEDIDAVAQDGVKALEAPLEDHLIAAGQATFLGRRWTYGLAQEAALKMREAAGAWTEAYPAMEYRHGPISIAEPGRVTWMFGAPPAGLRADVTSTGATFIASELDPMADLIRVQRLAVETARARGLDPDNPRQLTRSVILDRV